MRHIPREIRRGSVASNIADSAGRRSDVDGVDDTHGVAADDFAARLDRRQSVEALAGRVDSVAAEFHRRTGERKIDVHTQYDGQFGRYAGGH